MFGFRFGGSLRMTMTTDAELLAGYVREGSDAAFRELVQRHLPMVYGAALRQVGGDAHLAKDVTQTAFVALAAKARKLEGRGTLAGWLYLSAHHAAAQMVRTERRRKIRKEAHAMQERLTNGETTAEWERVRPAIDAALREIGEMDREAVLLRFFEGRPFAAVGASLNVSEDAARMRVERALDKLRGALARHGITSTAAALGSVLTSHASVVAPAALVAEIASAAALGGAGVVVSATIFMKTLMIALAAVAVVAIGGALYQAQAVPAGSDGCGAGGEAARRNGRNLESGAGAGGGGGAKNAGGRDAGSGGEGKPASLKRNAPIAIARGLDYCGCG